MINFLIHLRNEISRTHRSGKALSLLLLRKDVGGERIVANARQTLKAVRANLRETDIAGFLDENTIGILLPYTDESGAKKTADTLSRKFISNQFTISVSTYPDENFNSILKYKKTQNLQSLK